MRIPLSVSIPKAEVGCYILMRGCKAVYVGMSTNVLARVSDHEVFLFDSFLFFPCAKAQLRELERELIKRYAPPINRQSNKRWRSKRVPRRDRATPQPDLALKIRTMKRGQSFLVMNTTDRKNAIVCGNTFKDAGVINFDIKTFKHENQFKVCAV